MNLEFSNPWFVTFAFLGLVIWQLEYFGFFTVPIISLPEKMILQRRNFFLPCLAVVAWSLIGFSLMGPRKNIGFSDQNLAVNDLFFVVDISRSMLAVDMRPNRLEVAKKQISDFIKDQLQVRIGLIIFSEKAFTLLPLTLDYGLILQSLAEIEVGKFGSGTNIGDSLALAVARLSRVATKNRAIILLTDGVSNVDSIPPIQAAQVAVKQKIRIYTIGIGTEDGLMPIGGEGDQRYFQRIPGGSIDFSMLERISLLTGAKSYAAKDEAALGSVLAQISALEKSNIVVKNQAVYKELYWRYLLFGITLFLAIEFFRRFWQKGLL